MIRIIIGELRKVWQGKSFWIMIAIAIVINLCYMQFSEQISIGLSGEQEISEEAPSFAYKNFDKQLAKAKDRCQFIEDYNTEIQGLLLVEQIQNYKASDSELALKLAEGMLKERKEEYNKYFPKWKNKEYHLYTDNLVTESIFAEKIYKKYSLEKDYNAYLDEIFEQEEEKLGVSIFADNVRDSFSEKMIRKTSEKYRGMKGTKTTFYSFQWLEKISENKMTDILIVLVIFIIAMYLVFEDKKKNLFSIMKATPCGRSRCIMAKLFTLAVSTVFVTFIIYLSMLIYIGCNFGLAGIHESIQSAGAFIACPYHFRVWQFLLISIFMKGAAFVIIALFIFLISMLSANYMIPFGAGMLLVMGNVLLYEMFASVGKYNVFHYLNIWSFIKSENLIGNYSLLNIVGIPVSSAFMANFLIVMLLAVLILANIFVFVKVRQMPEYSKKIKLNIPISRFYRRGRISKKLISYEACKIYRISGCAVMVVLFVLGMVFSSAKSSCYLSPNQESYRIQMKALEGKMTDEKEKIVLEKKQYYDDVLEQLKILEEKYEEGKVAQESYENRKLSLESKLALYPAFLRVQERYEYVKSHKNARFVYEDGYNKMIGKMDDWYIDFTLIIAIVLVIMQSTIFTLDRERGMEGLIRATPKGRKNSSFYKVAIGIINAAVLIFSFMCRNIYVANKFYGLGLWSVSISNLKGFETLPEFLPIVLCIALFGMVQLLIVTAFSVLVMFVSKKIGSAVWAIVIQLVVVVGIYVLYYSEHMT